MKFCLTSHIDRTDKFRRALSGSRPAQELKLIHTQERGMQLEGTSHLIRDTADPDAVMGGSPGAHRSMASTFEFEPARQSVAAAALDMTRYRSDKDKSFYPSETVSFFCRHLSAAVEVTDPGEEDAPFASTVENYCISIRSHNLIHCCRATFKAAAGTLA